MVNKSAKACIEILQRAISYKDPVMKCCPAKAAASKEFDCHLIICNIETAAASLNEPTSLFESSSI